MSRLFAPFGVCLPLSRAGLLLLAAGCQRQAQPPCADGWGAISMPDQSVHVRTDGDDSAPGTGSQPLATLEAALQATRAGLYKRIALGPGEFAAALDLLGDAGAGATDNDLVLEGCSAEETALGPLQADAPQIKVTEAIGVELRGLSLRGGARPLWVWGGASVTASQMTILEADWSGFVVDGPYSILDLEEVRVEGSRAVGGVGGYGAEIDGAQVSWEGGALLDNTAAGIVVNGETAALELVGVEISETRTDEAGRFGRGLQIQNYASASVVDCQLQGNRDAAIFSLLGREVLVERASIATVERASGEGGDGIVATGIDPDDRQLDPASFQITLLDNVIDGAPRAGALMERVTAALEGNQVTGAEQQLAAQEGAVLSGPDEVQVLTEALALRRELLDAGLDAR